MRASTYWANVVKTFLHDWLTDAAKQVGVGIVGAATGLVFQLLSGTPESTASAAARFAVVGVMGGVVFLVVFHGFRAPWRLAQHAEDSGHQRLSESRRAVEVEREQRSTVEAALAAAQDELTRLQDGRPRIRLEVVKGKAWPLEGAAGAMRTPWNIRAHNEGGKATFEAIMSVRVPPEITVLGGEGECYARWERTRSAKTDILNGGNDVFAVGYVDVELGSRRPIELGVFQHVGPGTLGSFRSYPVWQSRRMGPGGPIEQVPEKYLDVKIRIATEPPFADAPFDCAYRLDGKGLAEEPAG